VAGRGSFNGNDAESFVEDAVRSVVIDAPRVVPTHDALVAVAIALGRKLDQGAGQATAAVAAELRACLSEIVPATEENSEFDDFLRHMRTPMGDPANQEP
jgi:hypothetical protein